MYFSEHYHRNAIGVILVVVIVVVVVGGGTRPSVPNCVVTSISKPRFKTCQPLHTFVTLYYTMTGYCSQTQVKRIQ